MPDQVELRTVARPGSEEAKRAAAAPKEKFTLSWRTISFIATPLVLGLINLVEAHWEKTTAFTNGEIRYTQLIGEGKEVERVAPEQGRIVGQQRKRGMIDEAMQHAKGLVEGAKGAADFEREKGRIKIPVIDLNAQKTMALMKPQHDVMENVLHIVRLTLMKNEGLIISVSANLLETTFVGRGPKDFSSAELTRRVSSMGRLVEAAGVGKSQEDLSVRAESKFLGCK